jgi:hypothetical protein
MLTFWQTSRYSDRKRGNVPVHCVWGSLADCRLESSSCLSYRETIRSAVLVVGIMYSLIQKSPHMGKTVSLLTKRAVYGHYYTSSTHGCISTTHGQLALTHPVMRTSISNAFFRWHLYFHLVYHGLQMPPKGKNQAGRGLETSEASPRDSGDQSNDL